MAIAGRFPGGRPLRRHREMVLIYGRQRLRGTAALHACTFIVATNEMAIAGRFPGGRRRCEMVPIYGRYRVRGDWNWWWKLLSQVPKLGNRRRARSRFIGYCAEKRADLPGNYFVPFV
jgi:hypothetical protein